MRKISKKRSKELYQYNKLRDKFFSKEENQFCKATINGVCTTYSVDIHHSHGRTNDLLIKEEFFIPVCRACHNFIHTFPGKARILGLLI